MKIVQIFKDGSMNDLECKFNLKNCCKVLTECSKSQGNNSLQELFKWNYEGSTIHLYGWYDGEAGFENKHELIPNGSSSFFFGTASTIAKPSPLFKVVVKESVNLSSIPSRAINLSTTTSIE